MSERPFPTLPLLLYSPQKHDKFEDAEGVRASLAAYIGIMARLPRVPFYPYNVKIPRERAFLPSERAVP